MTAIVGVEETGRAVHMAADSISASHSVKYPSEESKLFRVTVPVAGSQDVENVLMGATTSWRFLQVLKHHLRPKPVRPDADPDRYMATWFSDSLRACLTSHNWTRKGIRDGGGFALAGFRGRLYLIQDEFDVTRPACGYAAAGAGESLALGAASALLLDDAIPADVVVLKAAEVACRHSPWCGGPIRVESEPVP